MISETIKNLFQYIDFLHFSILAFKKFDEVINEVNLLNKERNQLSPRKDATDKQKYDEVQAKIKIKYKIIRENIIAPIIINAEKLKVCDIQNDGNRWYVGLIDTHLLTENYNNEDLPLILKRKSQYIEYRTETKVAGSALWELGFFFNDLDELLKELFVFFDKNTINEFEVFEAKVIKNNPEALPPQQTETKEKQEQPIFKNNFDNITTVEIYKHFKAGLVEKGYLTEQELNEYLKAAFELKAKPETLFKLKHTPTKQKIYTVFYVYYKDISQKKHKTQKKYAALLGDYFEGYKTETIQTNWVREYKTKR